MDRQSHAQELIHRPIEQARFRIIEALHSAPDAALQKRAGRMGMCCVSPQICVAKGVDPVCIAGYCRDRMCPTCMRRRSLRLRGKLSKLVGSMNSPRFLTLTARDDGRSLAIRVAELYTSLRTLRRTAVWKRHVKGGVAVLEVKRNVAGSSWHPHLHLVIDGSFFPHSQLHGEWTRILGRDGTTDLKAIHDRNDAAYYIGSYIGGMKRKAESGTPMHLWGEEAIREIATALHRTRMIATFGNAHAVALDISDKEPEPPPIPTSIIGYATLRDAAIADCGPARKAATLLASMTGAWRQLFVEFAPPDQVADEVLSSEALADLADWIDEMNGSLLAPDITPEPRPNPDPIGQEFFEFDD